MTDKVIPLEELGKRGTLTVYNQAYVEELEAKIAHLTRHLEPQSMTTLFEQVEEEVKQEQRIKELEKELEQERKINEEIKVRFVKCSCTEEMKDKCLMFSENLCEGERCEELVDLVALVNQSELQNKCSELQKENAELKEQCSILADCNTCFSSCKTENLEMKKKLTKAKEIIKKLYSHVFQGMGFMELNDYNVQKAEAEQFLKECE